MSTTEKIEVITLKDGSPVTVRPIHLNDAPRLQAFHLRLSEESILFRFMGHPKVLSDTEAKNLTTVDYQDTMALVATIAEKDDERLVGVARYMIIPGGEPGRAEAAIIVEDDYQAKGLGAVLSDRLITYAKQHGFRAFVSFILPENTQVLRLLRRCGLEFTVLERDVDMLEIRITL